MPIHDSYDIDPTKTLTEHDKIKVLKQLLGFTLNVYTDDGVEHVGMDLMQVDDTEPPGAVHLRRKREAAVTVVAIDRIVVITTRLQFRSSLTSLRQAGNPNG